MEALILAAGYGTRLYPLTKDKPKPLLPINGTPLLNCLIEKIRHVPDLKKIHIVTNEKFFDKFQQWAQEHKSFPVPFNVVSDETKTPEDRLGSIGDINFILEKTQEHDDLLVLGGDNLFDYSLDEFLNFSRQQETKVTVGLFDIEDKSRATKYGVVSMGEDNSVVSFEEKPKEPKSTLIAMCLYYMPKKTLSSISRYINQSGKFDRAGDYIGWLSSDGHLCGFQFQGIWYDIGSLEEYEQAQEQFKTL